jgi:RNA polymerase sigma-70 factor (ECF subfamily)
MSAARELDELLVKRIRAGESAAWEELIAHFEGRLLAFVDVRLGDRAASEDIVQETFIGFLTSLPNFRDDRPLEGYLFSIAAHKLTDHLRRTGRRPSVPLSGSSAESSDGGSSLPGSGRPASSLARSGERRSMEEKVLASALQDLCDDWRRRGHWDKLRTAELLFLAGLGNKEAAAQLSCTEQAVANRKFEFLARLRALVRERNPSADVFPELAEEAVRAT